MAAPQTRDGLLAPKTLEAALALREDDAALGSPWLRLERVRTAETQQKALLDACCAYRFKEADAEVALSNGAWIDGDPLCDVANALPCVCAHGYDAANSFEIVKWLSERGARLDEPDWGRKLTPLHHLALRHEYGFGEKEVSVVDIMQWFLDRGADASVVDAFGRTPLHYALGTVLAAEVFPPTRTAVERIIDEEKKDADEDESEPRAAKVEVAEKLLYERPRAALAAVSPGVDVRALGEAWAQANASREASSDEDEKKTRRRDGESLQERFDRSCARRKRNEDRDAMAKIGAALVWALDHPDKDDGAATRALEHKAEAATLLEKSAKERNRKKKLATLLGAVEQYQIAAQLFARCENAELGATTLSNVAECALRVARLVKGARQAHWLEAASRVAGEALDVGGAELAVAIRVKTLHRRARAARDLGASAAAEDVAAALELVDDPSSRASFEELAAAVAPLVERDLGKARSIARRNDRFAATNGAVPRVAVPLVLDFAGALELPGWATVCCSWAKAARDESGRHIALRREASRWARALYQGGGGSMDVDRSLLDAHLLVARHVLERHYEGGEANVAARTRSSAGAAAPASSVREHADALLERWGAGFPVSVLEARRHITYRDSSNAPLDVQYPNSRSPTDDLDDLEPVTLPYNARDAPERNGYGTRHQEYRASIRCGGFDITVHNYFKFSVIRSGYGTQYRLRVDAVPAGDEPLAQTVETRTNFRGIDPDELDPEIQQAGMDYVELDDAGSLLDYRDTFDDSRRPYDFGWRHVGDDETYDAVCRALFDGAGLGAMGDPEASKIEILRFLLRLVGAPCKYNDCISSYPIVESDTIWETWKFALPGAPHPSRAKDELRQGQQFVQIDDEYRKREAELEEELQKQYVL